MTLNEIYNKYGNDIDWNLVCQDALNDTSTELLEDLGSVERISELYEYYLAIKNRYDKKNSGQYYTPPDVCDFMAELFFEKYNHSQIVTDPCCGCGNLILGLIKRGLILPDDILIMDIDPIALEIAKTLIALRLRPDSPKVAYEQIQARCVDFLSDKVTLNSTNAVIMNPPYVANYRDKENAYSLFLKKALDAGSQVSVVPQSFVGGSTFSSLREEISTRSRGDAYVFDNVPSGLFHKRKFGIFNSNTSNSVRACIIQTVKEDNPEKCGIRVGPMLRWKSEERPSLFRVARQSLPQTYQSGAQAWAKIPRNIESTWLYMVGAPRIVEDLIDQNGKYKIYVPTTPRYYTSASVRELKRGQQHILSFKREEDRDIIYLLLNSSWAYIWWRVFDGEITFTKKLLLKMTVPDTNTKWDLVQRSRELQRTQERYMTIKKNAGKYNENIKFSEDIIKENDILLFGYGNIDAIEKIHSNCLGV